MRCGDFASLDRSRCGLTIAGLIETFDDMFEQARQAVQLQNIRGGKIYPLFQISGRWPWPVICRARESFLLCVDICAEIEAGCDLVILSKFGQLEALRSGL